MAQSNHVAAGKATPPRGKRGGPRPNSGRPFGSKDSLPRKGVASEEEQLSAVKYELGKALKEIERLRNELNAGKPSFDKLSLEDIMELIARGQIVGDPQQIYALKVLLDRRPPEVTTKQQSIEDDENRRWVTDQLSKLARQERRDRDEELRQWIAEGRMDEEIALRCREFWADEDTPEWVPMPRESGHETDTVPRLRLQIGAKPKENGANAEDTKSLASEIPQPEGVPNGEAPAEEEWQGKSLLKLYGKPFAQFWINGRLELDSAGEIEVDEADPLLIEALIRSGCRKTR